MSDSHSNRSDPLESATILDTLVVNKKQASEDAQGEYVDSSPGRGTHEDDIAEAPTPSLDVKEAGIVRVANADLKKMESQVSKLCAQIVDVTEALSVRTSRSARVTVSHAATTDAIAQEATSAFKKLQEMTGVFLRDVKGLRGQFNVLTELAKETADVRAALTTLEIQVAKLVAKRNGRDVGIVHK